MMKNNIKKRRLWIGVFALSSTLIAVLALRPDKIPGGHILTQRLSGKATVADRVAQFGPVVRNRWQPHFAKANVSYPPKKLILVGLKAEKTLQVYASNGDEKPRFVHEFPVLAASGHIGPKLQFGDFQVPEGLYKIESLNPNSAYHLALRVSYPNDEDKVQGEIDKRTDLGGDIMIHGSNASIGCLAMGDEVAEDLFVLAAETGRENINVILCPLDFRTQKVPPDAKRPQWVSERYEKIAVELKKLAR